MKVIWFLLAYLNWTVATLAYFNNDMLGVCLNGPLAFYMTYLMITHKDPEEGVDND